MLRRRQWWSIMGPTHQLTPSGGVAVKHGSRQHIGGLVWGSSYSARFASVRNRRVHPRPLAKSRGFLLGLARPIFYFFFWLACFLSVRFGSLASPFHFRQVSFIKRNWRGWNTSAYKNFYQNEFLLNEYKWISKWNEFLPERICIETNINRIEFILKQISIETNFYQNKFLSE
jgi:hypothetical protein